MQVNHLTAKRPLLLKQFFLSLSIKQWCLFAICSFAAMYGLAKTTILRNNDKSKPKTEKIDAANERTKKTAPQKTNSSKRTFSSGAPGGVSSNLALWLKADAGTNTTTDGAAVTAWTDQGTSAFTFAADYSWGPEDPLYAESGVNYNPSVVYTGAAVHTIAQLTGPSISSSTSFVAGIPGPRLDDSYTAMWTSTSSVGNTIWVPYLLGNAPTVYGNLSDPGGTASITWKKDEQSFLTTRVVGEDVMYSKSGGAEETLGNALSNANTTGVNNAFFALGNNPDPTGREPFGSLPETIIYSSSSMPATDIQKIESYLGLKYSVTLDLNGTGGGNYVYSNGTNCWDATIHSEYQRKIIGLVKDNASELEQKQSKTSDDSLQVYIGSLAASNQANASSISNDFSSLVIGDNGDRARGDSTLPKPAGIFSIFKKNWKVTNTNFSNNFSLHIKWDSVGGFTLSHLRLLVSSSPDFSAATVVSAPTVTFAADGITVSGISNTLIPQNTTRYITIGSVSPNTPLLSRYIYGPGGVNDRLMLWIRSDKGIANPIAGSDPGDWTDQSETAQSLTSNNTPQYVASSSNYNPAVMYNSFAYHTLSYLIPVSNSTVFLAGVPKAGASADNYQDPWVSDDYADYPLMLKDNTIVHYGNVERPSSYTWRNSESSFAMASIYPSHDVAISKQGGAVNNLTNAANGTGNYKYLGDPSYGEAFGELGETIIYSSADLNATDQQKIESYLALKYGITMDNTGASAGNYILSNAATVWDASVNPAYHNQVIGIVKDTMSVLLQKQSHTADDKLRLFVGSLAPSNQANTGTIANQASSIVIGNDAGLLRGDISASRPAGIFNRLGRSWKVTNTNFAENFGIEVKWDSAGAFSLSDIRLLVSATPDFSAATAYAEGDNGIHFQLGSIIVSGISNAIIPQGQTRYITIASASASTPLEVILAHRPGGVTPAIWLRADAGLTTSGSTATDWVSQGTASATFKPANGEFIMGGSVPYSASALNYNPALTYTSTYHTIDNRSAAPLLVNSTVFLAGKYEGADYGAGWNASIDTRVDGDGTNMFFMQPAPGSSYSGQMYVTRGTPFFDIPTSKTWPLNVTALGRHKFMPFGGSTLDVKTAVNGDAEDIINIPASDYDATYKYRSVGNLDEGNIKPFGTIGETIVMDYANLTTAQTNRVESYLAIKYGLTLDAASGQYANSAGTNIYTIDGTYNKDIIGLMRDDMSDLTQKQSHTLDDKLRLFVGNLASSNASNIGNISNNLSSIVVGNNGGKLSNDENASTPAGIYHMFGRSWKIANTGFTDNFSMEIFWDSTGPFSLGDVRLLVSATPDFSAATVYKEGDNGIHFQLGSIIVNGIGSSIIAPGQTMYVTIGSASPSTTLPVEIVNFNATATADAKVNLSWKTVSETNNDYFNIERSINTISWETVAVVKSAGNSVTQQNYSTTDNNPYDGVSYYRLKQTDLDGKFTYAPVRTVKIDKTKTLQVYPNPVEKALTIKAGAAELKTIKVYNMNGQDLSNLVKTVQRSSTLVQLDVSALPAGTYNIKTVSSITRVLKQ